MTNFWRSSKVGFASGFLASLVIVSVLLATALSRVSGTQSVQGNDRWGGLPVASADPLPQAIQAPDDSLEMGAFRRVGPAVVTVVNTRKVQRGVFGDAQPAALGSGVIVDDDGSIVTNNHVIEGQQSLEVIFADPLSWCRVSYQFNT